MKKFFKYFGIFLLGIIVVIAAGLIYFNSHYPEVAPPKEMKFEYTAKMIERGNYLVNHVALCTDCHSTRDWKSYSGPVIHGTEGMGGEKFDETMGFPGEIYTRNITPAAIGSWTDGELFRAITSGVNKDGDVLFPLMPYQAFRQMPEDELKAIIAYIRTLKPIKNDVPQSIINFPVSMLIKQVPKTYTPQKPIDRNNSAAYGKYLVTVASCNDCHSPSDQGELVPGKEFSGGVEFALPFGTIRSGNITPDMETGIGGWSKEVFIARFKYFLNNDATKMGSDKTQTIMPWTMYAGMTDEDLGSIYDYLRTVHPVKNRVVKFELPNQQFMNVKR